LSLTDPSGFNFLGDLLDHATGFLDHYVMPYIPAVIVIAASSLDPFLGAAVASAMYGPKAGWSALAASFLFNAVGDYVPEYSWSVPKIVAHGVVGGITSEIGGGKFSDGFWAAAFAKASGYMGGTDGIVRRALVGGVTSEPGGGKFENGAITAAMGYLYGEAAKGKDKLPGRSLTSDERALAKKAFTKAFGSDDGFNYDSVRIIDGKYVFWQGDNYVVTPNGNIYWPHECGNLAKCGGAFGSRDQLQVASTFVHEMTHVLQYQQGTNVLLKGIFVQLGYFMGFNNPYVLPIDLPYNQMNIEQQAQYVRYQLYPDTVITK